jgi:hypothetical protein
MSKELIPPDPITMAKQIVMSKMHEEKKKEEKKKAKKKVEDIPGTKPHTIYRLKNGVQVPGGSFVAHLAGAWQSEKFIVRWANNLGLQGYDSEKYRDALADVGSCCHGLVEAFFLGTSIDAVLKLYPHWVQEQAQICFAKFLEWAAHYDFDPILIEQAFVSEIYKFGGTPDLLTGIKHKAGIHCTDPKCIITKMKWPADSWLKILLDWKTCKFLYKSHYYQVAGYNTLLFENGYESNAVGIVRIGRNEKEGFQFSHRTSKEILLQWEIFRIALQMLALQNQEPKWIS